MTVGALRWQLFPVPALVLQDTATDQAQAITVKKLTAYPSLAALLDGRLQMDRIEIDGAVVPQLSLRGLGAARGGLGLGVGESRGVGVGGAATPLERFVFRDLRWISRHGLIVAFDGEVDFDPNWRPRQAQIRRPDVKPVTDLTLTRQGQEDRWTTRINLGGGTANGEIQLQTRASGRMHLEGKLQPREIEVASALAAFNRRSVLTGKASGDTVLSANGEVPD